MLPLIPPNSFIITLKYPRFLQRVGQIYYFHHPRYGRIVKTLTSIHDGLLWFRGESDESVTTEQIDAVKHSQLIGRVIWVIKPTTSIK